MGRGAHVVFSHTCTPPWVSSNNLGEVIFPTTVVIGPKRRFWGPISTIGRALLVLHISPWLYTYSHCHQMATQQQPKGPNGFLGVHPEIPIFQPTHASLTTAKYSRVGPQRGADLGNSIAFGNSTSQRIYPKQHTPNIG